jgi:glucose-6-phosphate 1-epimerase
MPDPFDPVTIVRDGARAIVYPYGAHVASWSSADGVERLFVSERSAYRAGAAIRGGVPIIFPQFSTEGPLPRHGFARTRAWELASTSEGRATLVLRDDAETRAIWPHAFVATYDVVLTEDALTLALTVENLDVADEPLHFTGALHTYLRVADVADVRIDGLRGVRLRDQVAGGAERVEDAAAVRIDGEVDRIYLDVPDPLTVRDGDRTLRVDASGFGDVVVWNPGAERARELSDLEPDGWRRFVCVEAAAVARPVTLAPAERWTGSQTLSSSV